MDYPVALYDTEVFELNANLMNRFYNITKKQTLNDSAAADAYRKPYGYAPANQPPAVTKCASGTSNICWTGSLLGQAFSAYTVLLTNGSGIYCMSQQEDSAVLEALLRGDLSGRVDFARVAIMRAASDFDHQAPGETAIQHILYEHQNGFAIIIQNFFIAGYPIVMDVVDNWDAVDADGIMASNYIGDAWNSLDMLDPDIGIESEYLY